MAGKTISSMHLGQKIILVGLFSQLLFFGFFVFVAGIFHLRIRASPTTESQRLRGKFSEDWKSLLYALYVASGLILVRSGFRVLEYLQGNGGYTQRHEVFLYIFDGVLMLFAMATFIVVHPGKVIVAKRGELELNSWDGSGEYNLNPEVRGTAK